MTSVFHKKKLTTPRRVCLRLKEARIKADISLEEISRKTKIDKKHLQALEECRFRDLPEAVIYQKNFVKKYIEALGLDSTPFLSQYDSEEKVNKKKKHPHCAIKENFLSQLPMLGKYFVMILVVAILAIYLIFQVRNIIEPPLLEVFSPQDGYVTSDSVLPVRGKTDKGVEIYVNGKMIGVNEQGNFEEKIDLNLGVNTFIISAKKKHGKVTEITRYVVYKDTGN
ncbi:MAG: helix-turn-helix domain-containing protein [Candidatus Magasanikiibacteriota bacterium]